MKNQKSLKLLASPINPASGGNQNEQGAISNYYSLGEMMKNKLTIFAILVSLSFLAASCGSNSDDNSGEPVPPDSTFGLAVEVLYQFDLEAQVPALEGFELRGRRLTFEPGAATNLHSHSDRPGSLYVIEGSITEFRNGNDGRVLEVGDSWIEEANLDHWILNHTDEDAVAIVVDIVPTPDVAVAELSENGVEQVPGSEAPAETSGLDTDQLGLFDLGAQIEGADGVSFRIREIAIEPGGATNIHVHAIRPGIGFVLEGEFTNAITAGPRLLSAGDSWKEEGDLEHWVANLSDDPVRILVFDLLQ